MKKVLITGVNSYVGNSLETWLQQYPEEYKVDKISVRHDDWKEKDFSQYDSIVHVAGIAHQKETKKNRDLYYRRNRDLAIDLANKSKKDGVKHFVFLSTMSVYGIEEGVITEDTPLIPKTHYGISKKEAEESIASLEDENFKVAILRPPMIYGKGCPGNYQRLRKLALILPIFPDIENKRSMIYVGNLSEFIRVLIKKQLDGVYCPQNSEYVKTSEMVKGIAENNHKNIKLTKIFNPFIKIMKISLVKKVFGDLVYDQNLMQKLVLDNLVSNQGTIILSEE